MTAPDQLLTAFVDCWERVWPVNAPDDWPTDFAVHDVELTHSVMQDFLRATEARAVGWWIRRGDNLVLLSFQAVSEMPEDVRSGFAAATAQVAMSRIELGCVRAAVELCPIVAREDAAQRGLAGSASWLERFGASQSLAVPIVRRGRADGVLAIATVNTFDVKSPQWQWLVHITQVLSQSRSDHAASEST